MGSQEFAAVHSVHFYDEPAALINRLCGIISSGLKIGSSVLMVVTPEHRTELVKAVDDAGIEIREAARDGRFIMCDAQETLNSFMVGGKPDANMFSASVGRIIFEAKRAARSKGQGLTVFGEMVALLWDEGNRNGALELEGLWNELINQRAFHLHCAYPRWSMLRDDDHDGFAAICGKHSHVLAGDPTALTVA
jgi:hypothetical protein